MGQEAGTLGAFGAMAAQVSGASGAPPSVAVAAAYLREAVPELLADGRPWALHLARALEIYLVEGGNLNKLVGVSVPRGKRNETPHGLARIAALSGAVAAKLAELGGPEKGRVRQLTLLLHERDPSVQELLQLRAPKSASQLRRLVRKS